MLGPNLATASGGILFAAPEAIVAAFRQQAGWCAQLGSSFTATVLTHLADDLAAGGPAASLLEDWTGDPVAGALALRVAGALHALALRGSALTPVWPPAAAEPWPAAREALVAESGFIRRFILSPPQTNEVARSAVLLGGFLSVAAATRLPLRLLEIGASAGLNLLWDRYRIRLGGAAWGDPDSPVLLQPDWTGSPPPLDAPLEIAGRAGCDIAPIDLADPEQRLRLQAYVWADQQHRLTRLQAAIGIARRHGVTPDRADALDWLKRKLEMPAERTTTILYQSSMWQYVPVPTRTAITALMQRHGEAATPAAPLAWLRYEAPADENRDQLRLRIWPGGEDRRLAYADAHGRAVAWLG